VRESLPRIQYANPALEIEVNKPMKVKGDVWGPEMVLNFGT
jgi:small subunit ribosomal protein S25